MGGVRVFSSLGVGTQQSFIRGGSAPWSTLTTLYTILDRKGTLFLYLPLGNGTPFKYLIQNVAPLSVAVNALTSLKYDKITRLGIFSTLSHTKIPLSALPGVFTDGKTALRTVNILQLVKSLPFYIPEASLGHPLGAEPPRIDHYREHPRMSNLVSLVPSTWVTRILAPSCM